MTTHLMGADANPLPKHLHNLKKTAHFPPKTLTEETAPNI